MIAIDITTDRNDVTDLLTMGWGVLLFSWLWYLARCPGCGMSVSWWAIKKYSFHAWPGKLLELEECPRCGDRGGKRSMSAAPDGGGTLRREP